MGVCEVAKGSGGTFGQVLGGVGKGGGEGNARGTKLKFFPYGLNIFKQPIDPSWFQP